MKQLIPGLWEIDEIGDDVHCYLWEGEAGVTLIDTGMPRHAAIILDAIKAHGIPLHSVKRILVTHADVDHIGSLFKLKQATGAQVICHAVEKELLEQPRRRRPATLWLRPLFALATLLPAYRTLPVKPDRLVVDGERLEEGFIVVHTPGHTPGHMALLHPQKRLLIAGDALRNVGNRLSQPPAAFTPDSVNAQRSIWKLAKKYGDDFQTIVFGHGPPILQNGGSRVKAYVSQIFSTEI